ALLVLALLAGVARAGEPGDARTHYEAGQKFYDEGRYDEAIAEYQSAYRAKPHPNVLYNIAQAYERLLEYGKCVTYFELYLTEAPADAEFRKIVENRLRLLRTLPARVSVSTIPEHVHAQLKDPQGKSFDGGTPHVFKVPAGKYTVQLSAPGWETE